MACERACCPFAARSQVSKPISRMSASRLRAIMGSSSTIKARRLPVGEELWTIWSSFPLVAQRSLVGIGATKTEKFPKPLTYLGKNHTKIPAYVPDEHNG